MRSLRRAPLGTQRGWRMELCVCARRNFRRRGCADCQPMLKKASGPQMQGPSVTCLSVSPSIHGRGPEVLRSGFPRSPPYPSPGAHARGRQAGRVWWPVRPAARHPVCNWLWLEHWDCGTVSHSQARYAARSEGKHSFSWPLASRPH